MLGSLTQPPLGPLIPGSGSLIGYQFRDHGIQGGRRGHRRTRNPPCRPPLVCVHERARAQFQRHRLADWAQMQLPRPRPSVGPGGGQSAASRSARRGRSAASPAGEEDDATSAAAADEVIGGAASVAESTERTSVRRWQLRARKRAGCQLPWPRRCRWGRVPDARQENPLTGTRQRSYGNRCSGAVRRVSVSVRSPADR